MKPVNTTHSAGNYYRFKCAVLLGLDGALFDRKKPDGLAHRAFLWL
jgi:hypothetical protein